MGGVILDKALREKISSDVGYTCRRQGIGLIEDVASLHVTGLVRRQHENAECRQTHTWLKLKVLRWEYDISNGLSV